MRWMPVGLAFAAVLAVSTTGATAQRSEAVSPTASCLTDTTAGDHTYTCEGLRVDARVPAQCLTSRCGLILELHGDTGTGLLEDAHTRLRALGEQAGYIVIAPTGPPLGQGDQASTPSLANGAAAALALLVGALGDQGSTWSPANDEPLVRIVREFAQVFRVDPRKVHVTGFSRGGYTTWRLLCAHADLFASAAPAAAGAPQTGSCFVSGRMPSRKIPILFLMGRTDGQVNVQATSAIRDAAIAAYHATGPQVLASDANYTHRRWTSADGGLIEVFEHSYENAEDGSWAFAKGHCIPGSTVDPHAPQYGLPCKGPTAFNWGEEVMRFFKANPMR